MDPKIAKRTQDSLGKIIKKPPLTDKLLSKPPFRFLHDIVTSVIKTTGFMKGLFTDAEMNSENVKDKDTKLAFLQKTLDMVCLVTGKTLSVKLAKVIAGHEPEKTNEFLQALAHSINMKVDNDDYVKKILNKGKESKPDENIRERSKSGDRRKREEKRDVSKDKEERPEKEERHQKDERRDRERSREGRNREDKHRNKDDRHKDRVREEDRDHRTSKKNRDEGKENESPEMVNGESEHRGEEIPPAARIPRPTSAKGHRRRREEDEPAVQRTIARQPEPMGEDDLPPQVAEARKLARPSSARPAPPRRKQEGMESEPAMRLGSGKPTNLIVDDDKVSDEDETFLVEDSAPPPPETDQPSLKPEAEEEGDHGGLVKTILETKKELEGGSQQRQTTAKTQIERPHISDAQRRKQREHVQREIDKLRASIQTLTRSANPLGKIMDYVQEDLDSMQKEQEKWKAENKEHALALKREKSITDQAVEPMKAQLAEIDQAIKDQLDLIAAVKSNIIKNDQKIDKMLRSIARS